MPCNTSLIPSRLQGWVVSQLVMQKEGFTSQVRGFLGLILREGFLWLTFEVFFWGLVGFLFCFTSQNDDKIKLIEAILLFLLGFLGERIYS